MNVVQVVRLHHRWGRAALIGGLLASACGVVEEDEAPAEQVSSSDAGFVPSADAAFLRPDSGVSVVDFPDAGAALCDPVLQTCPSGQKCLIDLGQPATCSPLEAGEPSLDEPCAAGDCQPGLACILPTLTATQARCAKICDIDTGIGCASLGRDFECRGRIEGTPWGACRSLSALCDPYTQAPCPLTEACQPFLRRTGAWEFRCRAAGPGAPGDRCDGTNPSCRRETACVSSPRGTAVCQALCVSDMDCPEPTRCVGVVDEPPFLYCAE